MSTIDPALFKRKTAPEPQPYPAPSISSRDGVQGPRKAAVVGLVQHAEALGWRVATQYAKGCMPHATTGRPRAERESIAVRLQRSGRAAVAVYAGGSSWSWECLWTWGSDAPIAHHGTLTAFKAALS